MQEGKDAGGQACRRAGICSLSATAVWGEKTKQNQTPKAELAMRIHRRPAAPPRVPPSTAGPHRREQPQRRRAGCLRAICAALRAPPAPPPCALRPPRAASAGAQPRAAPCRKGRADGTTAPRRPRGGRRHRVCALRPQLQVWSFELPALAHHVGAARAFPTIAKRGGEGNPPALQAALQSVQLHGSPPRPAARRAAAASQENSSCMKIERLQFCIFVAKLAPEERGKAKSFVLPLPHQSKGENVSVER